MYSAANLRAAMPDLIRKFDVPVLSWSVRPSGASRTTISVTYNHETHGRMSPRAEISTSGEIYNPYFYPRHLSLLFKWLDGLSYNPERIQARSNLIKHELVEKVVAYEIRNNLIC
jgi:hypothetical protein